MSKNCCLSTVDNPYNPITDFDKWFSWDIQAGYNCCGYLDRVARTSEQFTEEENIREIERAIDEIVMIDPFGIYIKVDSPDYKYDPKKVEALYARTS